MGGRGGGGACSGQWYMYCSTENMFPIDRKVLITVPPFSSLVFLGFSWVCRTLGSAVFSHEASTHHLTKALQWTSSSLTVLDCPSLGWYVSWALPLPSSLNPSLPPSLPSSIYPSLPPSLHPSLDLSFLPSLPPSISLFPSPLLH